MKITKGLFESQKKTDGPPSLEAFEALALSGNAPSAELPRSSLGEEDCDDECDDEDSIHSQTSEEREGGAGGESEGTCPRDGLPRRRRDCKALYLSLSLEQDPAQPTRLVTFRAHLASLSIS